MLTSGQMALQHEKFEVLTIFQIVFATVKLLFSEFEKVYRSKNKLPLR